jgi:hypothetical protein
MNSPSFFPPTDWHVSDEIPMLKFIRSNSTLRGFLQPAQVLVALDTLLLKLFHSATANIDLAWSRCYDLAVSPKLPVIQCVRCAFAGAIFAVLLGFCAMTPLHAQSQKRDLPDPVKFINKADIVANVVHAVLDDMGFKIEIEDRKAGKIITRPYEFITGSLTSSEVDKVAVKGDAITGSLLKAQYSVEAILEIVSPTETMVTIRTKMETLSREVDGTEKWIPLESLGIYERRILGRISAKLLHNDKPLDERKGFWNKGPQPVDPRQPRFPTSPSR